MLDKINDVESDINTTIVIYDINTVPITSHKTSIDLSKYFNTNAPIPSKEAIL